MIAPPANSLQWRDCDIAIAETSPEPPEDLAEWIFGAQLGEPWMPDRAPRSISLALLAIFVLSAVVWALVVMELCKL